MEFPDNLKYSKDHEWVRLEGNTATIGITDYAQHLLGDIVFVELPNDGEEIKEGETFGAVESVKSVSDIFTPVSGKIVEVNSVLQDSPEVVNEDCYGEGWMIKVDIDDPAALDELMDSEEYEKFTKEEGA